jgi:magnesium-transporting ATPase (P-type)
MLKHLRETHGPNEFQVAAQEHILLKFAKQVYENPLILLLLASAVVSLMVGNSDDAISIAVAVTIVLTGELLSFLFPSFALDHLKLSERRGRKERNGK